MRLVIEVTESERTALRTYLAAAHPGTTYSALFRALLRLAVDGTVPRAKLKAALAPAARPVLNVTVAPAQADKPAPKLKPGAAHGWDLK